MKVSLLATAIAGSMMLAGTAQAAEYVQADDYTLTDNGSISGGIFGGAGSGGGGGVFKFNRVAYGGSLGGTDFTGKLMPSGTATGTFVAICLEFTETLSTPYLWKVDSLANAPQDGFVGAMGARATDLEYLLGGVYAKFGQATIGTASLDGGPKAVNDKQAFALQLAVWEIANESAVTYSLSDGVFGFNLGQDSPNGSIELANLWLGYLNAFKNGGTYDGANADNWTKALGLVALIGTGLRGGYENDQDFVGQVVPIPAAAWLLGSGLLGLFGLARRKKVAAAL